MKQFLINHLMESVGSSERHRGLASGGQSLLVAFLLLSCILTTGTTSPASDQTQTTVETAPASPTWPRPSDIRKDFDFNQGWRFCVLDQLPPNIRRDAQTVDVAKLDDAAWEMVNLPHTVRLEPLNASGGVNYQGVCWYRKHFALSDLWRDRKIYLRFGGAMATADVWLNGVHLASHYCGYLPFTVDLSKQARFDGENIVTVRLDNSNNPEVPPGKPQDALDFTYFGGLYRGVHLQVLNPLHVTDPILANKPAGGGVFVSYPEVSAAAATVRIQTDVANEMEAPGNCKVSQTLLAPDGTVAAAAETNLPLEAGASRPVVLTLEVKQPALWHPYHPSLYVLHTVVSSDHAPADDVPHAPWHSHNSI